MTDEIRATVEKVRPVWDRIQTRAWLLQRKVLRLMGEEGIGESDFAPSTGYGYADRGRGKLDRLYARFFGTAKALVRPQIVSGTHSIALGLLGLDLHDGDEILLATGEPYESLRGILNGAPGSLAERGVRAVTVALNQAGKPDLPTLAAALSPRTRVVFIQRSRGYNWRPALTVAEIGETIAYLRRQRAGLVVVVDNCYGEMVEDEEPSHVGADLVAGSLIKNPGGGIVPCGGYLAGAEELVDRAAARLTAPGLGGEVGANPLSWRLFFQGFFLAPHVVAEALQGAVFAAGFLADLGLETSPGWDEARGDIVQAVRVGTRDKLLAFCRAIQEASPVDAHVRPVAGDVPGYRVPVVMAAGTFVQGGSLELSADAPLGEPYTVYLQGGLTKEHTMAAVLHAAGRLAAE